MTITKNRTNAQTKETLKYEVWIREFNNHNVKYDEIVYAKNKREAEKIAKYYNSLADVFCADVVAHNNEEIVD